VDREANRTLISVRIQMLMALFGKKVNEEGFESVKRVYCDALEGFDTDAITGGFKKAEQSCERLPSPRLLRDFCGEFSAGGAWRYSYTPSRALDPETKAPVDVKIDPVTKEVLYKAHDCPEGRAFLKKLREIARGHDRPAKEGR
jgi:hypothetical protein